MTKKELVDLSCLLKVIGKYWKGEVKSLYFTQDDTNIHALVGISTGIITYRTNLYSDYLLEWQVPDDGWEIGSRKELEELLNTLPNQAIDIMNTTLKSFEGMVIKANLERLNRVEVSVLAAIWRSLFTVSHTYARRIFLNFGSEDGKYFIRYDQLDECLKTTVNLEDKDYDEPLTDVNKLQVVGRFPKGTKFHIISDTAERIMKEEKELMICHEAIRDVVRGLKDAED